jgi:hypothetical protein
LCDIIADISGRCFFSGRKGMSARRSLVVFFYFPLAAFALTLRTSESSSVKGFYGHERLQSSIQRIVSLSTGLSEHLHLKQQNFGYVAIHTASSHLLVDEMKQSLANERRLRHISHLRIEAQPTSQDAIYTQLQKQLYPDMIF